MATDSFIDGLKTRAEKAKSNSLPPKKRIRSGYASYESGDPLISRPRRVDLTKNISRVSQKKQESGFFETEKKSITVKPQQRSYSRDVLGLVEDVPDMEFDTEDIKRKRKKTKKKNRSFIRKHKILTIILVVFIAAAGVGYFWGDSIISRITGGRSGIFDFFRSMVTSDKAEFKTGPDGRTNILVFGTSGYDMSGNEGNGVHDGAQLTDSIMVVSIDQVSNDIAMISLPRDLKTKTCTSAGKINELYYCNNKNNKNEDAGAYALRDRVTDMLGIEIQYYAHLNWSSLIQIVDAIGGITVVVDEDINDPDWTGTVVKAGVPTVMNGEQALGLARARHGTAGGDFTRGESQQRILMAIKEKISSMNIGVGELINLANILGDNLHTDFTAGEINAAAKVFSSGKFDSMRQVLLFGIGQSYLTTGTISGISYVFPTAGINDYSQIKEHVKASLNTNPISLENAKILVLNGSGVTGAAESEANELKSAGFKVSRIDNAPSGEYFEHIYLYNLTDKEATAEKIRTYYNSDFIDSAFLPSGIDITGVDFVIILGVGYTEE